MENLKCQQHFFPSYIYVDLALHLPRLLWTVTPPLFLRLSNPVSTMLSPPLSGAIKTLFLPPSATPRNSNRKSSIDRASQENTLFVSPRFTVLPGGNSLPPSKSRRLPLLGTINPFPRQRFFSANASLRPSGVPFLLCPISLFPFWSC